MVARIAGVVIVIVLSCLLVLWLAYRAGRFVEKRKQAVQHDIANRNIAKYEAAIGQYQTMTGAIQAELFKTQSDAHALGEVINSVIRLQEPHFSTLEER